MTQPFVVKAYNGMGGVDLVDRALSDFRPKIIGKKWYCTLLVNALNISVVYTWRLYELLHDEKIPQKDWRRKLVEVMVKISDGVKPINRSGPSYKTVDDVHFDNKKHYPVACPTRRCTLCKKNCRIQCSKCNKSLNNNNYFQKFHEK